MSSAETATAVWQVSSSGISKINCKCPHSINQIWSSPKGVILLVHSLGICQVDRCLVADLKPLASNLRQLIFLEKYASVLIISELDEIFIWGLDSISVFPLQIDNAVLSAAAEGDTVAMLAKNSRRIQVYKLDSERKINNNNSTLLKPVATFDGEDIRHVACLQDGCVVAAEAHPPTICFITTKCKRISLPSAAVGLQAVGPSEILVLLECSDGGVDLQFLQHNNAKDRKIHLNEFNHAAFEARAIRLQNDDVKWTTAAAAGLVGNAFAAAVGGKGGSLFVLTKGSEMPDFVQLPSGEDAKLDEIEEDGATQSPAVRQFWEASRTVTRRSSSPAFAVELEEYLMEDPQPSRREIPGTSARESTGVPDRSVESRIYLATNTSSNFLSSTQNSSESGWFENGARRRKLLQTRHGFLSPGAAAPRRLRKEDGSSTSSVVATPQPATEKTFFQKLQSGAKAIQKTWFVPQATNEGSPLDQKQALLEQQPDTLLPLLRTEKWTEEIRAAVFAFDLFRWQAKIFWQHELGEFDPSQYPKELPQPTEPKDLRGSYKTARQRLEAALGPWVLEQTAMDLIAEHGMELLGELRERGRPPEAGELKAKRALLKALAYLLLFQEYWPAADLDRRPLPEQINETAEVTRVDRLRSAAVAAASSHLKRKMLNETQHWEVAPEEVEVFVNCQATCISSRVLPYPGRHPIIPIKFKARKCGAIVCDPLRSGDEAVKSFIREAFLWAEAPRHPNLAPLLGAVIRGEVLMLITIWPEKGTLWDCLHESISPIPMATRLDMLASIADGLAALHSHDLCHGSLTSACVLVCGDSPSLFTPMLFRFSEMRQCQEEQVASVSSLLAAVGAKPRIRAMAVAKTEAPSREQGMVFGGDDSDLLEDYAALNRIIASGTKNKPKKSLSEELKTAATVEAAAAGSAAAWAAPDRPVAFASKKIAAFLLETAKMSLIEEKEPRREESRSSSSSSRKGQEAAAPSKQGDIYALGVMVWEATHRTPPWLSVPAKKIPRQVPLGGGPVVDACGAPAGARPSAMGVASALRLQRTKQQQTVLQRLQRHMEGD